jgi:hypothetical protein
VRQTGATFPHEARAATDEPLLIPAGFGSLPGYIFTKSLGIPAFVTPDANPDEANHAPNGDLEHRT